MRDVAPIVRFFGDAEHRFLLRPAEIVELERVTGTGIGALFARVSAQQFYHADVLHTLRLALIGGGSTPEAAAQLVRTYAERRPFPEYVGIVVDTLAALWEPADDTQELNS